MAGIKGPDFITLLVRNLEQSRRFYTEMLGFKPSPEARPNAVAFSAEPISFAIRKTSQDLDAMSQISGGIILWFKADDASALCNRLKSSGVTVVQDITDSPFGKTFTFRDPDGYLISTHDGG
jgi:catechol 2,3-dioxygenase-like lactoylglutathione lyase family enzyme